MREHAAGALEHDVRAQLVARASARRARRSRLDGRGVRAEQPRRFGGMRRGDRRRAARLRDGRGERGIGGDRVERIGIEHERNALRRSRARRSALRARRSAEARAADDRARARAPSTGAACAASARAAPQSTAGGSPRRIRSTPCRRRRAARRGRRGAARRPCRRRRRRWRACRTCPCARCARAARARPAAPRRARCQSSRWPARGAAASASRPSECTDTAPQRSTPSPVSNPGFSAMNVAVAAARIVGAVRDAGVGVESARHVEREDRNAGSRSRSRPAPHSRAESGRARPMPNRPSTMSASAPVAPERPRTVVPPPSTKARYAAAASAGSLRRVARERRRRRRRSPRAAAARRRRRRRRCCRARRARAPIRRASPTIARATSAAASPGALHQRLPARRCLERGAAPALEEWAGDAIESIIEPDGCSPCRPRWTSLPRSPLHCARLSPSARGARRPRRRHHDRRGVHPQSNVSHAARRGSTSGDIQ